MSRNDDGRFGVNPSVDINRSRFVRNSSHKTSFNVGELIPFYVDEVLPGDTFSVDTSQVVRLQTLLTPIMDNIYLDTYYFFVPNRLVWQHWQNFMGENGDSAWIPQVEYSVPQLKSPTGGWQIGTIADKLGIPTGIENLSVNALPFRAYAKIVDDWFRDQNLQDPVNVPIGDADSTGVNTGNYITDLALGGKPFIAAKKHDYFTSALPSPQKGNPVTIPVTDSGNLPVYALNQEVPSPLTYSAVAKRIASDSSQYYATMKQDSEGPTDVAWLQNPSLYSDFNTAQTAGNWTMSNLWAVSTGEGAAASINDLRLAFAMQKLLEKDARGGTRYIELLKSHFGVTSPDARLQRSEYLGGNRIPISINQVIQSSGTATGTTPQGTVTGQSVTSDVHSDFTKSFVEHGFVIGLAVARYDHTYQQGLERFWTRKGRYDYYWPVFQSLGEQPVYNREIYAQGTSQDDEVFGYQEAWADYRYKPSRVSGQMRSASAANYDIWHLADDYASLPKLSSEWIAEDGSIVNRVLAVSSTQSDQFIADFYIQNTTVRPMPMYSIPGLIDHF